MIKYRPHRGTLADAMSEEREFNTLDEMYEHIANVWNSWSIVELFTKEDLIVSDDFGKDSRIDWKETRYVCTKRMGHTVYDDPQCIGMCSFEEVT